MQDLAQPVAVTTAAEPERFRDVPRYLWVVLASAFLGWMFDAADLNLLTLVLAPSVGGLLGTTDPRVIGPMGGAIVGIKLVAWGIGGILFGVITDRVGRTRAMVATILIYSIFTGLSGAAVSWIDFAIYQALAGVGIGGEWAAGAALIAETWPTRLRARALQIMQMAFAFGYFIAALINLVVGPIGWRWVFVAGALPAVLTLIIRRYIREPERWVAVRATVDKSEVNIGRIFRPDLRRSTIVGSIVAAAMMVGSWGGTIWIPPWIPQLLGPERAASTPAYVSYAFMAANVGAALGYITLMFLTDAIGRRASYFIFCAGALLTSEYMFRQVNSYEALLPLMPVFGYFAIGGFGTFAAYLPELFPTKIRATGQGFCWNVARLVTGLSPIVGGWLVATSGSYPAAAAIVALVFAVGLVAIWFGPETKGVPLRDV